MVYNKKIVISSEHINGYGDDSIPIKRIEDLRFFVNQSHIEIESDLVISTDFDLLSRLLVLSLGSGSKVVVKFDSKKDSINSRNLVMHRLLRVPNLKFIKITDEFFDFVYQGKAIIPSIEIKPKKYLIADAVWEILMKSGPIRIILKYLYRLFLFLKYRLG